MKRYQTVAHFLLLIFTGNPSIIGLSHLSGISNLLYLCLIFCFIIKINKILHLVLLPIAESMLEFESFFPRFFVYVVINTFYRSKIKAEGSDNQLSKGKTIGLFIFFVILDDVVDIEYYYKIDIGYSNMLISNLAKVIFFSLFIHLTSKHRNKYTEPTKVI